MQYRAEDKARQKRSTLQMHRLERMTDVVYAIVIWRCFVLLPRPTAEQWKWEFISVALGALTGILVFRSTAAALVGIAGGWGWLYAIENHRLLLPEVTEQYTHQLKDRILAEPITAILTIPMAFCGPILWQISWMCYRLVVLLVRRRRRKKRT